MKFNVLPAATMILATVALSSCDKAAEFVGKLAKPKAKEGEAAQSAPAPSPGGQAAAPGHPMLETLKQKMERTRAPVLQQDGPAVRSVGEADYDTLVASSGSRVVVMDYYADWCGPCKMLSPVLEQIASESGGKVVIGKINVDSVPALAEKAGVRSIPDVRVFRDGRQVDRFVGLLSKQQIDSLLAKHMDGLDAQPAAAVASTPATTPSTTSAAPPTQAGPATFQRMNKNWMPPGIQKR